MELEITNRHENPLLEREELNFRIRHPKESSPKRKAVREALADQLGCKASQVIVDNMEADFGRPETVGYAKHYRDADSMQRIEAAHLLKRNGLYRAAAAGDKGSGEQ